MCVLAYFVSLGLLTGWIERQRTRIIIMVAARWLLCMALCALALAAGVRSDDPDQCGLYNSDCSAYGSGKISVRSSFKRLFVPCCCCCFCCIPLSFVSRMISFTFPLAHSPSVSVCMWVCVWFGSPFLCCCLISFPLLVLLFLLYCPPSFVFFFCFFFFFFFLFCLFVCLFFVCFFFSLSFSRASC